MSPGQPQRDEPFVPGLPASLVAPRDEHRHRGDGTDHGDHHHQVDHPVERRRGVPLVSNAVTARDPAAASVAAGSPLIATSSFGACRPSSPIVPPIAPNRSASSSGGALGHELREGRRHERLTGVGQSRQAGRDRGSAAEPGDVDPMSGRPST